MVNTIIMLLAIFISAAIVITGFVFLILLAAIPEERLGGNLIEKNS